MQHWERRRQLVRNEKRPVTTHVAHLLAKLRLRDRVQAVVLAHEAGVVEPGDPEASRSVRP